MSGDTDVRSRLAGAIVIGSEALLTTLGIASVLGIAQLLIAAV